MKTRKLWALPGVLLALCLVLALPAAALEAEEGAAAPTEPRWNEDAEGVSRPGCMSWTFETDKDWLYFDVRVLDGEGKTVYEEREYCETDGNGRWCSMLLSYLDEGLLGGLLPAGDYSFQVRATQYNEPLSEWSEPSRVYHYTQPSRRLEAPSGARWAGLYPFMTWTEAADGDLAFDYFVRYYFSANDSAATDPDGLTEASGTLHMSLDRDGMTDNHIFVEEQMAKKGAGWYYFTVQAVSGDRDQYLNSPESALSDAIYFNGKTVEGGGPDASTSVSGVTAQGGKLSFSVSSVNGSGKDGSLFALGLRNGRPSDAVYTTSQKGDFTLDAETAMVFFLEEETWIPLAKAIRVTAG